MNSTDPLIRMGFSPHPRTCKKIGSLSPRNLLKISLFTVIIILLSFHLPLFISEINYLVYGPQNREQTIQEILTVLESHPTGLANVTKEELAEVIYEEAIQYNQDPKFILALIAIESSFQNWSVSERGAKGLMQVMPYVAESIAQEIGVEWSGDDILFNPFLNIKIGIYYLSRLIQDFNHMGLALEAYNYGPTYIKERMGKKKQIQGHFYHRILSVYQNL